MSRPSVPEDFEDLLDKVLVDLGYPEHVVRNADHTKKVAWLAHETDTEIDVSEWV